MSGQLACLVLKHRNRFTVCQPYAMILTLNFASMTFFGSQL